MNGDPTPTKERLAEFFKGLSAFGLDGDPAIKERDLEKRAIKLAELRYYTGEKWPESRDFVGGFFHPEGEFYYLNHDGEVVCDRNSVRGPSAITWGNW